MIPHSNLLLTSMPFVSGGHGADREIFINMKHGVEAKNYADVSPCNQFRHCIHVKVLDHM